MDQRLEEVDRRFEEMDRRFDQMQKSIDQRFNQMQKSMDQRFNQMQKSMDQRFAYQEKLTIVIIGGIFGLIGFVIWDRKTTLLPLEKKLDQLEKDSDIQNPKGSRMTRLINIMEEITTGKPKVAETLKTMRSS